MATILDHKYTDHFHHHRKVFLFVLCVFLIGSALELWFSTEGNFVLQGILAVSGDNSGCHKWSCVEPKDAANYHMMHRRTFHN